MKNESLSISCPFHSIFSIKSIRSTRGRLFIFDIRCYSAESGNSEKKTDLIAIVYEPFFEASTKANRIKREIFHFNQPKHKYYNSLAYLFYSNAKFIIYWLKNMIRISVFRYFVSECSHHFIIYWDKQASK